MPNVPDGLLTADEVRGYMAEELVGESGRGGGEANARRRCESVTMGCGCDRVSSLSVSITDARRL